MRTPAIISLILLGAISVRAEGKAYAHYETIVLRQMFGRPPAGFDPTKNPNEVAKVKSADEKALSEQQEKVKKSISFTAINTSNGETMVGFSDNADPQNPLHYFMREGETRNGWLVKEVDPVAATMTIEKEGVEVTLSLGGDSSKTPEAVTQTKSDAPRPMRGGIRDRRRQLEESQRADAEKRAEEAAARAEEERRAREEERAERREMYSRFQEDLRKVLEERDAAAARNAEKASSEEKPQADSQTESTVE